MSDGLSLFEDDPTVQRVDRRPRRAKSRRTIVVAVLAGLLVLLLAGGLTANWYSQRVESALSELAREDLMPGSGEGDAAGTGGPAPSPLPQAQGINYVLLGSDSYGGADPGRSDTLIVAHVNASRDKVYLISFPRDMWIDIPGHGKGKINWAYAFGGPALTIRTLEQLTGTPMNHAAVVDFEGFIQITEALGGVEVFNKRALRTSHEGGHYFPAGMVELRGAAALAYVRERYNLPNGDLDRAENQRDVVSAILDKAARPSVLANPATVDAMLTQLSGAVTVDRGLTNEEIRETALSMRIRGGNDIVRFQAPITGTGWAGDQAIVNVDHEQMAELGAALREDRLDDYLARFPNSCTGPNC
ncbi:MAG: LCP family protein [Propionibacteriaceae bacterium]|nr:LCP family protein [Propionibacteriaceae bacterium]